ncbi:MAG TPA: hypothetical protein VIN39_12350 [Candidatus Dormibacteraeota bacterium]
MSTVFQPGDPVAQPGIYTCDGPCLHTWIAGSAAVEVTGRKGRVLKPAYPALAAACRGRGWVLREGSPTDWVVIRNRIGSTF